jgi:hypothetical protein
VNTTAKREVITRGAWYIGMSTESKHYAAIRCCYCGQGLRAHMNPGTRVVCSRTDHPLSEYIVPDDIAAKTVKLSHGVHRSIARKQWSFSEAKYAERMMEQQS